jgi:hypothetical protein
MFTYDNNGFMKTFIEYKTDETIDKKSVLNYDANGNLEFEQIYIGTNLTADTYKRRYSYESFDANGNWLRRNDDFYLLDKVLGNKSITVRKITYY